MTVFSFENDRALFGSISNELHWVRLWFVCVCFFFSINNNPINYVVDVFAFISDIDECFFHLFLNKFIFFIWIFAFHSHTHSSYISFRF